MSARILVVDDEADIRFLLNSLFTRANYEVIEAASGAELDTALKGLRPQIVVLDLKLPDADGINLVPVIRKAWPTCEVIVLTGYATLDAAVAAIKLGAYDFQQKPFDSKALLLAVERALEHQRLVEQASSLRQALVSLRGGAAPVYQSAAMRAVVRTAERVAPADVPVFLQGESGTGKEVIADLIHALSPLSSGPFVKVHCATLPREGGETALFGAGTGESSNYQVSRDGLFRQAEGGTLLLDEITELPLDLQGLLVRVLEDGTYRPVGSRMSLRISCRLVTLTNRPVEAALKNGKLREDLFYRISTVSIALPPLRERREDILPLAESFLARYAAQAGQLVKQLSPEAAELLLKCDWPGNVRQLQNEIQRAVLLCEGATIQPGEYSSSLATTTSSPSAEAPGTRLTLLEAMERNAIIQVLVDTRGNKLEASKRLGIGRQTLYNKLKTYQINP